MANVTVIQPAVFGGQAETIRCAAYCRVSSSSEDQLNSFAVQMAYYSQLFEHSDTEMLVEIYADEGISGTGMTKRSEFNRMLADCRRGKIDRICTKSISRFARNTRDCLKAVRELKSLGITIKFEKEGFDTAQMSDEVMLTVMGSLAQEESVSISQNMRWSVQKRFANGTYRLAVPPFGYQYDGDQLVVNDDEADIIRQIYAWYLSGIGIACIVDRLNQCNIPRHGRQKEWYNFTVRYILTNERYIGDALFQKSHTTSVLPFKKVKNNGQEQQYYITGTNPPIIDKADFDRVQTLIAERSEIRRYTPTASPFSKKLYCQCCGAPLQRKVINEKVYWICGTHIRSARKCPAGSLTEKAVMDSFNRMHNKLLISCREILVPLLHHLQELREKQYSGNQDAIAMHREIAKLLEQSHVIARLHTKGFLDDQKYLEQSTELTAKIAKLRAKQKKLYASDTADEMIEQIEMLIDYFTKQNHPKTAFDEDAFTMMVEKITVTKGHDLIFHLIGGLKFTEKNSAL